MKMMELEILPGTKQALILPVIDQVLLRVPIAPPLNDLPGCL
jgi:hypothetical protein